MSYFDIGLTALYVGGAFVLTGLYLNDLRRVYNNFLPSTLQAAPLHRLGADYSLVWLTFQFRFSKIDPELLTEIGRVYRQRAVWHERLLLGWIVCGIVAMIYFAR